MFRTIAAEIKEHGEYRRGRIAIGAWQLSLKLCLFRKDYGVNRYALNICCLWFTLWETTQPVQGDMMDSWGIALYETSSIHVKWGKWYTFIYLPWMWYHCQLEVLLNDGTFVVDKRDYHSQYPIENEYNATADYKYKLKSGEIQIVQAVVRVERRTWYWKWFKWLGWPRKVRTCIDVEFSSEVGERSGSWKGGVVGCGYDLLDHETPMECLKRMESERVFK